MMTPAQRDSPLGRRPDSKATVTSEDVIHLCGHVPDWKVVKILASQATYDELEAAVAWGEGESDVLGGARLPLAGRAAELYEIITADEDVWED